MKHYFAADGNYGDATDGVIVDTTDFTEEDWEKIENAPDEQRVHIAVRIVFDRSGSWNDWNPMTW